MTIRWQTGDGKWTHEADDRTFAFKPGINEWRKAFGVVMVPADVGNLVVLLDVHGQETEEDVCWFDDVEVHRLADSGS